MKKINYKKHVRFEKQFSRLIRKYRTLEEDLITAQIASIELLHLRNIDNHGIKLIPGFDSEKVKIYKIKKFACKTLKGRGVNSGIRVIYAFYPKILLIEYLEIYYKEKSDSDMDYAFMKDYFDLKKT